MKTPTTLNPSQKLHALSEKAANLAKTSPKLGKIAGLSVILLKACALIPVTIANIILNVGMAIANAFGSIRSINCREDLKENGADLRMMFVFLAKSPIFMTRVLVHGFKGVMADPTTPRDMDKDFDRKL